MKVTCIFLFGYDKWVGLNKSQKWGFQNFEKNLDYSCPPFPLEYENANCFLWKLHVWEKSRPESALRI